jgi:hypothetical protein
MSPGSPNSRSTPAPVSPSRSGSTGEMLLSTSSAPTRTTRTAEGYRRNRILAALPDAELARLVPSLTRVTLDVRRVLFDVDQPITHVYFPESAVGSVLGLMSDATAVETATVGNEGMVGLPVFLGADRTPAQAFCQIPGDALRMESGVFRREVERGGELRAVLNRYTPRPPRAGACRVRVLRDHPQRVRAAARGPVGAECAGGRQALGARAFCPRRRDAAVGKERRPRGGGRRREEGA